MPRTCLPTTARRETAISVAVQGAPPRPEDHRLWRASPNFDDRKPNFVVIHDTADDTVEQALRTLTDPVREVSAHYLVARDGTIFQLVGVQERAWHAGVSSWGGDTDMNSASIGIELDNNGYEPLPAAQIAALVTLLGDIRARFHIPAANILGHADVAPTRKTDPSIYFPWKTLAEHGFGLWCDPPYPIPPSWFDDATALQALGYDVSDLKAAIIAFKRHLGCDDSSAAMNESDRPMLYCLIMRKRG